MMMVNSVPVSCINHAAITYHVPVSIILSVMKQEGGKNGQAVRNKNGTADLGVMQINSVWVPVLARYGYSKDKLQYDPCKNVEAATWLINRSMADGKTAWQGIGNYHSKTPAYNKKYRESVYANFQRI